MNTTIASEYLLITNYWLPQDVACPTNPPLLSLILPPKLILGMGIPCQIHHFTENNEP
jgi:hypothetical protein